MNGLSFSSIKYFNDSLALIILRDNNILADMFVAQFVTTIMLFILFYIIKQYS